jgi:hypothetical protein
MFTSEQRNLIEEGPPYEVFKNAFEEAHRLNPGGGLCLEFGVGAGRSYAWQMARIIERYYYSSLVGYDSFEGLPKETEGVWYPERHSEGCLSWTSSEVAAFLEERGLWDYQKLDLRFRWVKGFYEDSLTEEEQNLVNNVIFVNIDVDIYSSTMAVLDFIKPFLKPNVVVYWDDWKDPDDIPRAQEDCQDVNAKWGEHLAWEHWHEKNPEIIVEEMQRNQYNQRSVIVRSV